MGFCHIKKRGKINSYNLMYTLLDNIHITVVDLEIFSMATKTIKKSKKFQKSISQINHLRVGLNFHTIFLSD